MTVVLFSGPGEQPDLWREALTRISEELEEEITLHTDPAAVDPAAVEVLIVNPNGPEKDFRRFPNLRLIQSIWAGVEVFMGLDLPDVPLCRMVEPGLTEGMTEYIVGHVLLHHMGVPRQVAENQNADWNPIPPPLARDRRVVILGLGQLGQDAARALQALNFDVAGWSRTGKSLPYPTFSGDKGLRQALSGAEIVVTILPNTPGTKDTLNADTLALLAKGAAVINPGRGELIDDEALLAALESGRVGGASLDVFDIEPLPEDHPYWSNPNVLVTPHVAAETRTNGAARVALEQIGRLRRGEALHYVVDKTQGY